MFKHQKKEQQPKQRDRWRDDDEDNNNTNKAGPKVWQNKPQSFSNSNQQPSSYPQQQQTFQQKPQPKREESFKLEQKLLDDILQPTGISIRPSDHLLNEFYKRSKNLDRDKIFNGIMDKLMNYQAYITSQESVKTLTKCLYLVDYLVQNKLEDIYEAFEERQELFTNIKTSYPTNKKINDICNNIINAYEGSEPKSGYQQQKDIIQNDTNNNTNNVLLLDIDFPEQNNNTDLLNPVEQPNTNSNSNNLLEDIFEINPNCNTNANQNTNQNNHVEPVDSKKNQGKGFAFIKQKPQVVEEQNPKPKPSFIKSTQKSSIQSDLDNLFNTPSSTKNTDVPIINIANNTNTSTVQDLNTPIDLTKISFTNPQPQPQGPTFNYDLVYNNTNVLKEKNEKDPFNFVNDMIKSKSPNNPN